MRLTEVDTRYVTSPHLRCLHLRIATLQQLLSASRVCCSADVSFVFYGYGLLLHIEYSGRTIYECARDMPCPTLHPRKGLLAPPCCRTGGYRMCPPAADTLHLPASRPSADLQRAHPIECNFVSPKPLDQPFWLDVW